jgi:hypothetical protein
VTTKIIRVDFFVGMRATDANPLHVSDVFNDLAKAATDGRGPAHRLSGGLFQIREFSAASNGHSFRGALLKFRDDHLPHAGIPEGDERELELLVNEALIEKTYFIFYKQHQLLGDSA